VLHTTQHLFFLLAGFLFYWPLMSTRPESPQLSPPLKCLYLFVQTIPAGIIGALITYARPGLYPHYEQATVRPWGIGLKVDQEIAGLTMWIGMNTLFLGMLTVIFLRWAGREERADFDALREESRIKRQKSRDAIAEPKASGLAQQ
jgi:putative copper resistance protein D